MKTTLDIEKIDAVLKRAAFKEIHGTREERSGRFLPSKRRPLPAGDGARKRQVTRIER